MTIDEERMKENQATHNEIFARLHRLELDMREVYKRILPSEEIEEQIEADQINEDVEILKNRAETAEALISQIREMVRKFIG